MIPLARLLPSVILWVGLRGMLAMEEPVERRLAVILAADVVGYSALMEQAEEATYAQFSAFAPSYLNSAGYRRRYQVFTSSASAGVRP
jgi:hypothetical protein